MQVMTNQPSFCAREVNISKNAREVVKRISTTSEEALDELTNHALNDGRDNLVLSIESYFDPRKHSLLPLNIEVKDVKKSGMLIEKTMSHDAASSYWKKVWSSGKTLIEFYEKFVKRFDQKF